MIQRRSREDICVKRLVQSTLGETNIYIEIYIFRQKLCIDLKSIHEDRQRTHVLWFNGSLWLYLFYSHFHSPFGLRWTCYSTDSTVARVQEPYRGRARFFQKLTFDMVRRPKFMFFMHNFKGFPMPYNCFFAGKGFFPAKMCILSLLSYICARAFSKNWNSTGSSGHN